MTTILVTIPQCTALHLPTPQTTPLPLSTGDLTLNLIPANPPSHPSQTLTLTIGSASFPLLPISPIQKIQAKDEHPSYIFAPVAADGGDSIGQVKIIMKSRHVLRASQGEWEATEALCHSLEALLKEHKTWDEKILFVNDEWEQTPQTTKGWGELIAGGVMNAGNALANRLNTYTDRHVQSTNPTHPAPPSNEVISGAAIANARTAGLAERAEAAAKQFGNAVHEGGKKLGAQLPDSIVKPASAAPTPEADKGELRKVAEEGWNQLTIAAKGLASAAGTVAGSVSGSAHKAVEHNFGKQADKVAQDIGQTGANVGSTALSAGVATSAIVQGANVSSGVAAGKEAQNTV